MAPPCGVFVPACPEGLARQGGSLVPCPPRGCGSRVPAHLSEEGDWLLAHGLGISDVGTDDLSERFLDALSREKATAGYIRDSRPWTPEASKGPRMLTSSPT